MDERRQWRGEKGKAVAGGVKNNWAKETKVNRANILKRRCEDERGAAVWATKKADISTEK